MSPMTVDGSPKTTPAMATRDGGDWPKGLAERLERLARCRVDALVVGETGAGKAHLARLLHDRSAGPEAPLVWVDAALRSAEALALELFGASGEAGLLSRAQGGTLLLRNLPAVPLPIQSRLRTVLETGRLESGRPIDLRLIATSREPAERALAEGRIEAELHARLLPATLSLPPLRDRGSELPGLVAAILDRLAERHRLPRRPLGAAALEALAGRAWPGNVRELEATLRASLLAGDGSGERDEIAAEALNEQVGAGEPSAGFFEDRQRVIDDFERRALARLLSRHRGCVKAAARTGGVPRGTFYRLLNKHKLDAEDFRDR